MRKGRVKPTPKILKTYFIKYTIELKKSVIWKKEILTKAEDIFKAIEIIKINLVDCNYFNFKIVDIKVIE